MSEEYAPSDVPLCRDRASVEERYAAAERDGEPFFAVERYDEGYAVTYDLLPAGYQLTTPARRELDERLTRAVEDVVGDDALPTSEVSRSVGDSLGSVSLFEREETAREVAAVVSRIVLDRHNWVEATPPDGASPSNRRN